MAVTFKLLKCTGTDAGTETDSSNNPCFLSSDIHSTTPANYPIVIPTGATPAYSYEQWLRWECTALTGNYVQNIRFWGPLTRPDANDSPGNKLRVMVKAEANAATPINTSGSTTSVWQETTHYSEGTSLQIPINTANNKIDAVGEKTGYLVLQLQVEAGANAGSMETLTFNIQYDET